jgi:SAM-dependent methyltransferase
MWDKRWQDGLPNDYDVVATAAALHWFDVRRLGEIFIDVLQVLRPGGVFLFAEPVCAQPAFSAAFEAWKTRQPNVRDSQTWERFWSRANALLGYDHTQFLGSRDPALIGDRGIPVLDYVRMLERAGFVSIDVILRDAETVAIASSKP